LSLRSFSEGGSLDDEALAKITRAGISWEFQKYDFYHLQIKKLIIRIILIMEPIKKTCAKCQKDFWIIKQEQEFLQKMNLFHPVDCPGCRQERRLKDRGERNLYRTVCQKCNNNIIVFYDPKRETRRILCKECYLDFFEKNPVLI